uniref:Uncharacterized protein n=1 Tax=Magnetococcus massalia (strain MO-1) TaxID=451514 RepID=A0A1S7LGC6_MAGMO|nr:Conserved exported protein of unknown function [Candidatus Magnetococcus massalia]
MQISIAVLAALWLALPADALAYVGPGAGLSMIGSLVAVIAGAVVVIAGVLIYPIRKMMAKKRKQQQEQKGGQDTEG